MLPLPLTNHGSFLHWVWPSSFYSFLLCHDNTGTSVVSFHVRRCDSAAVSCTSSHTSAVSCLLSFILVVPTVNHFFLSYFRLYWPHLLVVFSSAGSLQRVLSFSPPKKIMNSFCFPFLLLRGLPAPFIPFCSCALQCLLAHCSVHFPFLLRGGLRVPFLFFV